MFLGVTPFAQAQMAVVDARAVGQLIKQIRVLREQLASERRQLESMTGMRGMDRLLAGTPRNYLPSDWQQLAGMLNQLDHGYGSLAAQLQRQIHSNAVLTPEQVAMLSAEERAQLEAARQSAALLQTLTREALSTTSRKLPRQVDSR
jgi:type IV secretion system protein VirB5